MKKTLLVCLFFAFFLNARAYDFSAVCESGQTLYYYILPGGQHEVGVDHPYTLGNDYWYGFTQPAGELIIPGYVEHEGITYTVVKICQSAFDYCQDITAVVLPNTIRRIGAQSFYHCTGISSEVIIPDQCSFIGGGAFYGCSAMSSLTLGTSVDTIQYSAFEDCTGLQSIYCNTPTPPFSEHIPSNPYYEDRSIFHNVPTEIPVQVNCLTLDQFLLNWDWSRFINLEGVFLGAPSLVVSVNNPELGTAEVVSVPTDCNTVTATVRAIPSLGHTFGYWKRNGAVVSYSIEYTFMLDHDCVMTACFDCAATVYDSIGYPDHVIGRKFNSGGQVMGEYVADFEYDQQGVMNRFYFPDDLRSCRISFFEYPSKPSSISAILGNGKAASDKDHQLDPPVTTETISFYYEDDRQISHIDHYKGNEYYDLINHKYDYYYRDHRLFQKDSRDWNEDQGEWLLWNQHRYVYEDGNKTQINAEFTRNHNNLKLSTITINRYDDAHRLLTAHTDTYDASGEIASRTLKTYSYIGNKTDSIVTRVMNHGVWENSKLANYVYDFKNRVVEYQTGSWLAENSEWNITKKILYDFNDETQKLTVSFWKKADNSWERDVFSGQSLFNDPQLNEWQRQLNAYSAFQVNQFEISLHYNTVEMSFPILSEWYYEILGEDGLVTYQHLEYSADTTINNDKTKVIVRTNQIYDKKGQTEVTHEYLQEHDGKVYWWNKTLQEFTVLYDYHAEPGDGWEIKVGTESIQVHVDSVGNFEYQGDVRRVLHVSDAGDIFSGDIVVGFGHLTSFFPEKLMRPTEKMEVEGLRCYWVGDALLYHQGDADCDAVFNQYHEVDETETNGFALYPNPTSGLITIRPSDFCLQSSDFRITNLLGQTLMTGTLSEGPIDVSDLPGGLYFFTIDNHTVKIMKK